MSDSIHESPGIDEAQPILASPLSVIQNPRSEVRCLFSRNFCMFGLNTTDTRSTGRPIRPVPAVHRTLRTTHEHLQPMKPQERCQQCITVAQAAFTHMLAETLQDKPSGS